MPPKKLLLPLLAGSSHFTFKFYYIWCIHLIYNKPACQKHNPFFINLHGIWETPLSFDLGGGIWLQQSYEWKVMVLVSYWLPNCTHRIISGECAFTSAPQKAYWPCQYDRKAPDNTGCLRAPNMASLAWTNYSRPQLLSVWTPLLTVLTVTLNWQIMLMLIFFFCFFILQ